MYGIWQILTGILVFFGYFRMWLNAQLGEFVTWGNGNLLVALRYVNGLAVNLGAQIANAIQSNPANSSAQPAALVVCSI